jgi:hypothetical protein
MAQYARVEGGVVVELFTPPDCVALAQCFHPDLVPHFVAIPPGVAVEQRWLYGTGGFTPPAPAE